MSCVQPAEVPNTSFDPMSCLPDILAGHPCQESHQDQRCPQGPAFLPHPGALADLAVPGGTEEPGQSFSGGHRNCGDRGAMPLT